MNETVVVKPAAGRSERQKQRIVIGPHGTKDALASHIRVCT